ncbi:hypothetical protein BG003_008727, partial [Podila horticola]
MSGPISHDHTAGSNISTAPHPDLLGMSPDPSISPSILHPAAKPATIEDGILFEQQQQLQLQQHQQQLQQQTQTSHPSLSAGASPLHSAGSLPASSFAMEGVVLSSTATQQGNPFVVVPASSMHLDQQQHQQQLDHQQQQLDHQQQQLEQQQQQLEHQKQQNQAAELHLALQQQQQQQQNQAMQQHQQH